MNRPLLRIAALLLLALWLPATQHCGLEAAGLIDGASECHDPTACDAPHNQSHCDLDNCQPVENSAYNPAGNTILITAPLALFCLSDLPVITPETGVILSLAPERTNPPPELAPTWQFVARAALSPRAPSPVS